MKRGRILPLALAAIAFGCGEPVLDARDLDRSIAAVRDSLEQVERPAFDEAVALVRRAGAGEIPGTEPFPLDGLSAAAVLAEAERIGIRRERALELEAAAAHREALAAEQRLALLEVLRFEPRPVGDARMEAELSVRNGLGFPVGTAWLRVEVSEPGGASNAGEELVTFQPALADGEQRTVNLLVSGEEARELPVVAPMELRCRFVLVDRGSEPALQVLSPEERARIEAAVAESERRIRELDQRLAATAGAESGRGR